ncbi:MAG: hypothetical protein AAGD25_09360 [Cyanobacteria bacterium P01_F01_bin.150]
MNKLTGQIAMVRAVPGNPNSNAEPWIKVEGQEWQHYKESTVWQALPALEYVPKNSSPGMEAFLRLTRAGFTVVKGAFLTAQDLPQ